MSKLPYPAGDFLQVLPIAIPAIFGMVVLVLDLYLKRGRQKTPLALMTVLACGLSAASALVVWGGDADQVYLGGALATSAFGGAMALAVLLGTSLIGLAVAHHAQSSGEGDFEQHRTLAHGELYGLLLFGTSGMLALCVANDLVTFFVAIETLSICVYALTGVERRQARSAEAAMKYFVLGAFSAGFLLYGVSLLYGATHTLRLDVLAATAISPRNLPLATTGGMLLLIGLLFKVGAVPFHAWVPDAYEGAPSPVTGFMSVGVKVAAFAGILRVVQALGACGALGQGGVWILWAVAAVTVIAGNAGALTQRNPRRLMAYSGIAHSGYLLIGVVAFARIFGTTAPAHDLLHAASDAAAGVLFYLLAYAVANAGVFAVICHLERRGEDVDAITDLAGLGHTQPRAALVMTVCLLSLAGIPGTAGFLGKLWVFRAGIATGDVGLVVLALIASAISLYYYLYFVVVMYMREPQVGTAGASPEDQGRWASRLALSAAGLLTVILGVYPNFPPTRLLELVVQGANGLIR
ncbi:MAG: NADH-quinone oxidoreductase subunit N [Planctomycetota bacterium]